MYSVVCDRCGKTFIDEFNGIGAWLDEETVKEQAMESKWVEIVRKHKESNGVITIRKGYK